MSIFLGDTPLAVSGPSRNIGEIIQSTIPLSDAGLHLLDGALINGTGSYSAFVTYIAGLVSNYPDLFITETDWQQAVTDYGVCGKFVYDSTNNTVRLPKYSNKIYTGGGTAAVTGNGLSLGLTNGTENAGLAGIDAGNTNTLFPNSLKYGSSVGESISNNYTTRNLTYGITTDPEKSGIIADLSSITTSLDGYYYIVIANSVKTNIEVDIDEVMTDLNGKADVDLSNVKASGTSLASGWSMPSSRYIDLTLGANGATYTAPANGWFVLDKRGNAGQYLRLRPSYGFFGGNYTSNRSNEECFSVCPIKKGDVVTVVYTTSGNTEVFKFYYAEGEKNV